MRMELAWLAVLLLVAGAHAETVNTIVSNMFEGATPARMWTWEPYKLVPASEGDAVLLEELPAAGDFKNSAPCRKGFKCPVENALCCVGGEVCCPTSNPCTDEEPPKCGESPDLVALRVAKAKVKTEVVEEHEKEVAKQKQKHEALFKMFESVVNEAQEKEKYVATEKDAMEKRTDIEQKAKTTRKALFEKTSTSENAKKNKLRLQEQDKKAKWRSAESTAKAKRLAAHNVKVQHDIAVHRQAVAKESFAKRNAAQTRRVHEQNFKHKPFVIIKDDLVPSRRNIVALPQQLKRYGAYTYCMWLYPFGKFHGWSNIIHKGNANTHRQPAVWMFPGQTRLHVRVGTRWGWNTGLNSNFQLPLKRWTHICWTNRNGVMNLYRNGQQTMSRRLPAPTHNTGYMYAGDPWHEPAKTVIRRLVYQPKYLNAVQIKALMNDGKPTAPPKLKLKTQTMVCRHFGNSYHETNRRSHYWNFRSNECNKNLRQMNGWSCKMVKATAYVPGMSCRITGRYIPGQRWSIYWYRTYGRFGAGLKFYCNRNHGTEHRGTRLIGVYKCQGL